MKTLTLVLSLLIILQSSFAKFEFPHRMLQMLRVLSADCSFHGFMYNGQCFCEDRFDGPTCAVETDKGIYDTDSSCDDQSAKLDYLTNITPDYYPGDDDMFSRLDGKSIGEGQASYGEYSNSWIKMHDLVSKFEIFKELEPTDIKQGALGDCYLLAAFASLSTIDKGNVIKDVFTSLDDNSNHVYITRWLIDGKPRYVAVDDYIPGTGSKPFFASPSADNDFWPVILEKAWAKIHGTYMAIEAGWHTDVWQALTQAPGYDKFHSSLDNPDTIFKKIKGLLAEEYPVGSATVNVAKTNEVAGHAYSILGAYDVTLDNGSHEQLIHMYNPWNREVWTTNPWGDNSTNWTANVKAQVPYVDANDGAFFVSSTDYLLNFGATCWAELQDNYDIAFQDIAIKGDLKVDYKYNTTFSYFPKGNKTDQVLYVLIDQSDTRLNLGCDSPFNVIDLKVTSADGTVYGLDIFGYNVKIVNATAGNYSVTATVSKQKDYVKFFTITIYGPESQSIFYPLLDNDIAYKRISCPKNCSDHGDCNNYNGKCICDFEWSGDDCSSNTAPAPAPLPDNHGGSCDGVNCSFQGICIMGMCMCNNGYAGNDCEISENAVQNCSGNGVFDTLNNRCNCNDGFMGNNCETVDRCYGNCSGNGVCDKLNNRCNCNDGFAGDDCETSNCSGNGVFDTLNRRCNCNNGFLGDICAVVDKCLGNCSGNGVCDKLNNRCNCNDGFEGDDCEKSSSNQGNCSGNGVFDTLNNRCNCNNGFIGNNCETVDRCSENCSGNGVCDTLNNRCNCNDGFAGVNCETSSCSGNGVFDTLNKRCNCHDGFIGDHCQTVDKCFGNCSGNGVCDKLNNRCNCNDGFAGDDCETSNCSGNGVFDTLNKRCNCHDGFIGDHCQTVDKCSGNCSGNGVCDNLNNRCNCNDGFEGDDCEKRSGNQGNCSGNGVFDALNNRCNCNNSFIGNNCETVDRCYGNCSGNGVCDTLNNRCNCNLGFEGDDCDLSTCSGNGVFDLLNKRCNCHDGFIGDHCQTVDRCHGNCSGNGVCDRLNNRCNCNNGFTGEDCENSNKPIKPCYCSSHGTCNNLTGECKCQVGYKGKHCNYKDKCFGKNCSGKGVCSQLLGKCVCVSGYTGDNCQTLICGGNNCNRNGRCNKATGKCHCNKGFEGAACEISDKNSTKINIHYTPVKHDYEIEMRGTGVSKTGDVNASPKNIVNIRKEDNIVNIVVIDNKGLH